MAALSAEATGLCADVRTEVLERADACEEARPVNLRVVNVSKTFTAEAVLREVSFATRPGEFLTILGPSGCGKTTLLRIIAGLEIADRGEVYIGSMNVCPLPAHKRPVNTVFQNYALFPHLSVFENVAFGLRSRRIAPAEVAKRCERALQMLRIEELVRRLPHELSGGQKQRVALARALVNEPEVLLLDEPMSALDAKLRAEVQIELRRLQQRLGKTFILVTHDQDEAMTVSDRIIVMREGRIEQMGRPSDIYERPVNRFVAEFLGSANLIAARSVNGTFDTALGLLKAGRRAAWAGGSGWLAIRPERIRLCGQCPAQNGVRARIQETIYRGDHVDCFVEPGALRVRVGASQAAPAGSEVWLELAPEHMHPLDGE